MKHLLFYLQLFAFLSSVFTEDIEDDDSKAFIKDTDYYKGAVVEYAAMDSDGAATPLEVMLYNLDQYNQIMSQASGSDIIVFPEYGITGISVSGYSRKNALDYMVTTEVGVNYCEEEGHEVLVELSCMAVRHNMYLVVNLGEVMPCNASDCSEDGLDWYNTNLAFDRKGTLVAKYWKQNLFMEPIFQVPRQPVFTKFDTDFGVTFGMFICFDALWRVPAVDLVDMYNLSHVVYTTAWQDELPFFQAVSTQAAWAVMKNVNFLASGYHEPAFGQLGSGIYGPNGPIAYTFDPESGTVLVVGWVPKKINQPHPSMSKSVKKIVKRDQPQPNAQWRKCAETIPFDVNRPHCNVPKSRIPNEQQSILLDPLQISNEDQIKLMDPLQTSNEDQIKLFDNLQTSNEEQIKLFDHLQTFEELGNYSYVDLDPGHNSAEVSHTDSNQGSTINCYVDYNIADSSGGISYRLLAFTGIRSLGFDNYHFGVEMCGVVQCHDSFGTRFCGRFPIPSNAMEHCHLEGNFTTNMILPVSLTSNVLLPPTGGQFAIWESQTPGAWVAEYGRADTPDIYSMALYGRK